MPEKTPKKKNFFEEIKKINLVKKVAFNLRQNSTFRKPDHLKKIHYQIIGDPINDEKPNRNSIKKPDSKSKVDVIIIFRHNFYIIQII